MSNQETHRREKRHVTKNVLEDNCFNPHPTLSRLFQLLVPGAVSTLPGASTTIAAAAATTCCSGDSRPTVGAGLAPAAPGSDPSSPGVGGGAGGQGAGVYSSSLLSYPRVAGLADSMGTVYGSAYAAQGYVPFGGDPSAFYSPLVSVCIYLRTSVNSVWVSYTVQCNAIQYNTKLTL